MPPSLKTQNIKQGTKRRPLWQRQLPNAITLARGIAVIPILALIMGTPHQAFFGWVIFAFVCVSDYADGYFARRWKVVSMFGTAFDPILDKVLIFAVFVIVLARGGLDSSFLPQQDGTGMSQLAFVCAFLIIIREIAISGLREVVAQKSNASMPVIRLAKDKTVLQMLGIGGQILSIVALEGNRQLWISMLVDLTLVVACFITLYTGWIYSQNAIALLQGGKRRGRQGR